MKQNLDSHESKLQDDKLINPKRYSESSNDTRTIRGVNRTITKSKVPPPLEAKKVEVKQIDKNMAQIKAQIDMRGTTTYNIII